MSIKILICGLPGSGKTTLAEEIKKNLELNGKTVSRFNADQIRSKFNDWDFSIEGRIRQAERLKRLCSEVTTDFCVVDFIAALEKQHEIFKADMTIWLDTVESCEYSDTNQMFTPPKKHTVRIMVKNAEWWGKRICESALLRYKSDNIKEIL